MAETMNKCVIRYKILDPNLVYNYCGPSAKYHRCSNRKELEEKYIARRNEQDNFYNNLENSILKEGIRNPTIVNAGWISPAIFENLPDAVQQKGLEDLIICFQIGGSRLWVAQKHNISFPCIIRDFVGRFDNCPLIDAEEKVRRLYTDQPAKVKCDGKMINLAWSR